MFKVLLLLDFVTQNNVSIQRHNNMGLSQIWIFRLNLNFLYAHVSLH